jgi:prephenate dehydrogenase
MKHPLVIGNKGEIGSFILNGLLRIMLKALDIWCTDIHETDEEVADRIKVSDVIFLCVPLQSTMSWLLKHKQLLKDKILIEQCSLKEWLYNNELIRGIDIRSMHVLFRPSQTQNLEDRAVALFKGQFDGKMVEIIQKITQSKIVWYNDAKQHDKEMAIQQALLHRTILVLARQLSKCNGSTYISKKVLELDTRIRQGNKDLYQLIQENKYLPEALNRLKTDFDEFNLEEEPWKTQNKTTS